MFYRKETRRLDEIQPQELDKTLAHFVLKVRKQDGDEFEPDTLTSLFRSIVFFLGVNEEKNIVYPQTVSSPWPEKLCRSKRKQLRRAGNDKG